jgi:Ca-activated chloride channel family protein
VDVRKYSQEADVQIYAIGLFEPGGGPTPEERGGPELLNNLTEMSGGREFTVRNLSELPDIATKISMELRNQYVIGYKSGNRNHDGKWRKVKVKLVPPKGLPPLNVFNKSGYFAPGH